jgi:antitoxin VapB
MATTRLFRNGNSQAVRIPAELAYERSDLELEIERCGDELRIRPAGRPITGALQALQAFRGRDRKKSHQATESPAG